MTLTECTQKIKELLSKIEIKVELLTKNERIEIGRTLIVAKSMIAHGEWLKYLSVDLNIEERYARTCITLAESEILNRREPISAPPQIPTEPSQYLGIKALPIDPLQQYIKPSRIKKYAVIKIENSLDLKIAEQLLDAGFNTLRQTIGAMSEERRLDRVYRRLKNLAKSTFK